MPVPVNTNAQVQALVDEFTIKGGFRLALDEIVVPVALVANVVPDLSRRAIGYYELSAVNTPHISIYNPPGSGVIVTVTDIWVTFSAVNILTVWRDGAVLLNTSGTIHWRDMTQPAPGIPNANIRYEDRVAVTGNAVQLGRFPANIPTHLTDVWTLGEGQQMGVRAQAGTAMQANFAWQEEGTET
jgi:hypothetical protein